MSVQDFPSYLFVVRCCVIVVGGERVVEVECLPCDVDGRAGAVGATAGVVEIAGIP